MDITIRIVSNGNLTIEQIHAAICKSFPAFTFHTFDAAQQSVQADEATCSAYYHMHLAQKGDTRCGICGSPLRR